MKLKPTNKAQKYMDVAKKYMVDRAYWRLVWKAEKIAKERRASRLGFVHFELALTEMGG